MTKEKQPISRLLRKATNILQIVSKKELPESVHIKVDIGQADAEPILLLFLYIMYTNGVFHIKKYLEERFDSFLALPIILPHTKANACSN